MTRTEMQNLIEVGKKITAVKMLNFLEVAMTEAKTKAMEITGKNFELGMAFHEGVFTIGNKMLEFFNNDIGNMKINNSLSEDACSDEQTWEGMN